MKELVQIKDPIFQPWGPSAPKTFSMLKIMFFFFVTLYFHAPLHQQVLLYLPALVSCCKYLTLIL